MTALSDILDTDETEAPNWERDPAWDEPCSNPSYTRRTLPDGQTQVLTLRCGNRLREVCPSCSVRYQARVTRTLKKGLPHEPSSEEVENGARMPGAYLFTLTAPSFGPVHRDGLTINHGHGPAACERSCIGAPLDPSRYGYVHQAVWSYCMPDLVKATRSHMDRLGEDFRDVGDHFQMRGAVELQERLAPHLHLLGTAGEDEDREQRYGGYVRIRDAKRFSFDPALIPPDVQAQGEGVILGMSWADIEQAHPGKLPDELLARREVPLWVKKEKGSRGLWWARPVQERHEITSTALARLARERWNNPTTGTPTDLLDWAGSDEHLARRKQLGLPDATAETLAVPDGMTWGTQTDWTPKLFAAPEQKGNTVAEARSYIGKSTSYIAKDAGGKDGEPLPDGRRATHENRMRKEAVAALVDVDLTRTLRRWLERRIEHVRDEIAKIDARIGALHDALEASSQGFSPRWSRLYGLLLQALDEYAAVQDQLISLEAVSIPGGVSWHLFDGLTRFDVLGLDAINEWIEEQQDRAQAEIEQQYGVSVRLGLMTESEHAGLQRIARKTAFSARVIEQVRSVGQDSHGFLADILLDWEYKLDQSIRLRLRRIVTFFGQTGNINYSSRWKASFASDRRDSHRWREDELAALGLMLDPQIALSLYEFIASPTEDELMEAEQNTGPPTVPIS